ncbi:hypothetical protein [Nannocystis pusilla]|uniref:hypothetical protein n=1 Tax=Nannocystis pusilla TaxID=889268 RepID=UPI003B7E6F9F
MLVDASDAPEVLEALAAALRAGAGFPGQGAQWSARATAGLGDVGPLTGVRLIGGEQSNTAAVLGEAGVFDCSAASRSAATRRSSSAAS